MKVKFKNFKAFKGVHQINVKPLTVIIGKNNSGKSTISEAIDYYTRLKNSHYSNSLLSPNSSIKNYVNIDSLNSFSGKDSLFWKIDASDIDGKSTYYYEPLFYLREYSNVGRDEFRNNCIMTVPDMYPGEGSVFYYHGKVNRMYFEDRTSNSRAIDWSHSLASMFLEINSDHYIVNYKSQQENIAKKLKRNFKEYDGASSKIEDFNDFVSDNFPSEFNYKFFTNHTNKLNQVHFKSEENRIVDDLIIDIDKEGKIPNKIYYKADSFMFKRINQLVDGLCEEAFKTTYKKYKKQFPQPFKAIDYISNNRYYNPPNRSGRYNSSFDFDSLLKYQPNSDKLDGLDNNYSKSKDNLILGYRNYGLPIEHISNTSIHPSSKIQEAKWFGSIAEMIASTEFPEEEYGHTNEIIAPSIPKSLDKVILGHVPTDDTAISLVFNSQENEYVLKTNDDIKQFDNHFNKIRSSISAHLAKNATWSKINNTLSKSVILLKISNDFENDDSYKQKDFYVGIPFHDYNKSKGLQEISRNKKFPKKLLDEILNELSFSSDHKKLESLYINEPDDFLERLRYSIEKSFIDKSLFPEVFSEDRVALKFLKNNKPKFDMIIPIENTINGCVFTDDHNLSFSRNFIISNLNDKNSDYELLQFVDDSIQNAVDDKDEDFKFDSFVLSSHFKKIAKHLNQRGYKKIGDMSIFKDFSEEKAVEHFGKGYYFQDAIFTYSIVLSYLSLRKSIDISSSPDDPLASISYNTNNNSIGFRVDGRNFEKIFNKFVVNDLEYPFKFLIQEHLTKINTSRKNQAFYISLFYHFVESREALKSFKKQKISKIKSSNQEIDPVLLESFVITNCIANFKKVCFDLIYDYLSEKYFSKTIFLSENIILNSSEEDAQNQLILNEKVDFDTTIIRPDGLTSDKIVYNYTELENLFGKDIVNLLKKDSSFSSRISQLINNKLELIGMGDYTLILSHFKGSAFSLELKFKDQILPFNSVGAGTRSLISIFAHLSGFEQLTLSKKIKSSLSVYDILIIREPENFVHPSLVGKLITFLVDFGKKYESNGSVKILIETHSEIILRKIQVLIKDNNIKKDNVAINYVNKNLDSSEIIKIELNEDGTFKSDVPEDFFDINTKLSRDLWSID